MKKILCAIAITASLCVSAKASPYFRLIDIKHPQVSMGAYHNLADGASYAGGSLALITHSPADGCMIPGVCTSWTPLSIGATTDRHSLTIGASANILPIMRAVTSLALDVFTPVTAFTNLKSFFADPKTGTPDITFAAGPQFAINKCGKDVCGSFPIFFGGAWNF